MRIGIDCRRILNTKHGEHAGVGHYTYYLIKYLVEQDRENQYFLFFYDKKIKCEELEKFDNVKCIYFPGLENIGKIPFFYRHLFIPNVLRLYKLDIYHNPANIIPFFYFRKSILTIHDLVMYQDPDWLPNKQYFYKYVLIPLSIYKAKKIIAVSENTKNDLIKKFKVNSEKIEVILEGVEDYNIYEIDEEKIDNKFKIAQPYFLFISTLEPRKNLLRLVEAFYKFLKESEDKNYKLILAGKRGWKYESVFERIKELGLEEKIEYLGYISLEEKIYLLKNALAFVYPTLYEGFGLPILEAMNLGVPIITSNVCSIPELVIDNAVLIEPEDIQSITNAMIRISNDLDLREQLKNKGRGISKNFTWQQCAKKTLEVYKSLSK